jgi:transposase
MVKTVKYVGLDVHKNSISIAIADQERDSEVRFHGRIENDMNQLDRIVRKLISQGCELRCVYEAGPCGYHIYRHLTGNGIDCTVVAPSLIPKKSGVRLKNDQRDSITLARNHRAGELTAVYVPEPGDEALRDLVRARKDGQNAHRTAKQQLGAFLLRHNIVFSGKSKWSKAYFTWLAGIAMPHPAQQITLQEYIDTIHTCGERVDRFTEQIRQQSKQCGLAELIKALQSLRGISLVVAATLAAELGDFARFKRPSQLMAFVGLVPSEHSSGDTVKKGTITKTGNGHVRKALIEAAQAYRLPARKSRALLKRQEEVSDSIRRISWKAQCRLCGRFARLMARGKKNNVVKTAIARELTGFIWAVARELPQGT